ncbi:MAG: TetR/AcrR family transcriptional regulator [Pseudomonadota bacterium]
MARTQGSHSDITGPRLRSAAKALFARYGYAAVSMRQIASQVGVQAGALYNYTPDKQSLLFDIMKAHMDELHVAYDAHAENRQIARLSPVDRLRHFVTFHIRHNHARREAIFIAYMELRNLTAENFEKIGVLRRAYEAQLEAILNDGVRDGSFQVADTRITAMAVIAMLNGVNTWFREDGRLSMEDVEALYWDMVRKSVLA